MPRPTQQFEVIVRYPENGPTLAEVNNGLHDWFRKVLITKEFVKPTVKKTNESKF